MRSKIAIVMLAQVALVAISLSAADDPLLGIWTLNLAKSTFSPGPAPKSAMATFEAAGDGIKQTVNIIDAQGNPVTYALSYKFDGKDYPVTGDPSRDTTAWTRSDPQTMAGVNKKTAKTTTTQARVIAADGLSMTLVTTGMNPQGQMVMNHEYFEKGAAVGSATATVPAAGGASADKGKTLYGSYGCTDCHGMSGEGSDAAPNLTTTRLSPDQIAGFLEKPSPDARGAGMPTIAADSPDLQPLVDYIVSIKHAQ